VLDQDTRAAILKLHEQGHGVRPIAKLVGVARQSVREVVKAGAVEVPPMERASRLDPYVDQVRELYARCNGNLSRVAELLGDQRVPVQYSTLTAFCRRHEIGQEPKKRVGHYAFGPGQEMQHDTSPHRVEIAQRTRLLQCASLVLCYSRMRYAQVYPRWSRFECRIFLNEAISYFGGAAGRAMIDNSSVIIGSGCGKDAVAAPEMAALAERFGFVFQAHAPGDADRSAYVERGFSFLETNFYPGRTFESVADCNAQLRAWCDKVNAKYRDNLHARPVELFAAEQPMLKALPAYIPEVYELHSRHVDVHGFVSVHTNRYTVPLAMLGRQVEVRETKDRIRVFDGHRLVADHDRQEPGAGLRIVIPEHHQPLPGRRHELPPSPQEQHLRLAGPEFAEMVEALRKRYGGQAVRAVRQLYDLWRDYPEAPLRAAVTRALQYGLTDLKRIERLVLQQIAGDFFRLPTGCEEDDDG
jgi:transposase